MKALSLQECYATERALSDPDPLVRVAAVHHAGKRPDPDGKVRELLRRVLGQSDGLVARYAALTLARAGDPVGVDYLAAELASEDDGRRAVVERCLRGCPEFPLAILLNELLPPESVAALYDPELKVFLDSVLLLSREVLAERSRTDPGEVEMTLGLLARIDGRVDLTLQNDSFLDRGVILAAPQGEQPGFLCSASRKVVLPFSAEAVLEPDAPQPGRQVVFVASSRQGVAVKLLHVREDVPTVQPLLPVETLRMGWAEGGVVTGVAAGVRRAAWAAGVEILGGDGRVMEEGNYFPALSPGWLVFVEAGTGDRPGRCHPIPAVAQWPGLAGAILGEHAARHGLLLGRVVSSPAEESREGQVRLRGGCLMSVPMPFGTSGLTLVKGCMSCGGRGGTPCGRCAGRGQVPCDGRRACPRCQGSGKVGDPLEFLYQSARDRGSGRDCSLCHATGKVEGCQGKRDPCPVCQGWGLLPCGECRQTGRVECLSCQGAAPEVVAMIECPGVEEGE